MTRRTMEQCVEAVASAGIPTVDITGGAPEMNPDFRWFVKALREAGVREVIVRSNLTILNAHERYSDLPAFFREHGVRVVSSLPFHARERTDRQRGEGVFDRSIEAIRTLNDVGYAMAGSGLYLDLVYNPIGAFLPTGQADLEKEFKERLWKAHQVHFDRLFCITNMPISRFLESLLETGNYEDYMERLVGAFNPAAVDGLMCRDTISVGWDGMLYDCDFNQMLRMGVARSVPGHVAKFDPAALTGRPVQVHQHCYGCTAGAGSSCQGEVVS
jgi:radical SAM/Cys-rich protein